MSGSFLLNEPLSSLLVRLRRKEIYVSALAEEIIARVEKLRATNAFTYFDAEDLRREAARLDRLGPPRDRNRWPLFGLPVSVKDIFDVRGWPTTAGSSWLADLRGPARRDSSYVARWRRTGALIVGKTHLNQFAYGITGENLALGSCVQPLRPQRLTGGSSSGAAASVQGGATSIGLGTDTAGSLRVPAALSGLVAFRQSSPRRAVAGLFPLAPSFDSCGWLQRDAEDFALIYSALNGMALPAPKKKWRLAFLWGEWLKPCDPGINADYHALRAQLDSVRETVVSDVKADGFETAVDIFAPIQAYEAARIHRHLLRRHESGYEPAILSRLKGGLTTSVEEYRRLQNQRHQFCRKLHRLFEPFDFLVAPVSPYRLLGLNADHTIRRRPILQLTTPFSLGGLPALAVPWRQCNATVFQVIARRGRDEDLARLASTLARWLAG